MLSSLEYFCLRHLEGVLRLSGLYDRGNRNFKAVEVRHNTFRVASLPEAFKGFTFLQLSDLHLDLDPTLTDVVLDRVRDLVYNACVITGDFRGRQRGPYAPCLAEMARLVPSLRQPTYAILGNHESPSIVPGLESLGLNVLVNDTVSLERGSDRIFLSGAYDPYLLYPQAIAKMRAGVEPKSCSILLTHYPDDYLDAEAAGYDLMMAGHTHGGQICLPGGFPIVRNSSCPTRMLKGAWRYGRMQGYTSAGTGASHLPVRFWCPPEVTLHTLTSA
jgi:predicted MPP superfamily phosphohydrolase